MKKPWRSWPATTIRVAAWSIVLLGWTPLGHAQESRPFKPVLNVAETWDSNVFRVPSGAPDPQAAQGNSGKSDRLTTLTYGLRFDNTYEQQRFLANVSNTNVRYDKFTSLNRNSLSAHGQWDWHLSPRISGTLSAEHFESAVSQEDITLGRRLITTTNDNQRLTVDGWLFGGWHVLAGASHSKLENGQVFAAIPGSEQTNGEIGARYVAPSGSSITAMHRWSEGKYPGQNGNLGSFINNKFTVREAELSAAWIVSMRSTLTGRLNWLERRYDGPSQLDFSGLSGDLRYSWTPSGRLSVNAVAARSLQPYFQLTSSYRADTTYSIGPTWAISEKVSLSMNANRLVNDYRGPVIPIAGPLRRDTTNSAQAQASWAAHRMVTLGASVVVSRRRSNYDGFDFNDTTGNLTATLVF